MAKQNKSIRRVCLHKELLCFFTRKWSKYSWKTLKYILTSPVWIWEPKTGYSQRQKINEKENEKKNKENKQTQKYFHLKAFHMQGNLFICSLCLVVKEKNETEKLKFGDFLCLGTVLCCLFSTKRKSTVQISLYMVFCSLKVHSTYAEILPFNRNWQDNTRVRYLNDNK